jgi:photosystem II stability/assembly factor-like uncharacterized protein
MFRKRFLSLALLAAMLVLQSVPTAQAQTYCDHAQFVSDLTAPDGSPFAAGAAFTKTWRLQNVGTCTWTTAYNLVWVGGDALGAPASVKLPVDVSPGQMVDISVNLTAPATSGHYKGLFKISNAAGAQFGIGDSAGDPFWVDINVVTVNAMIYDFVANAQYAQWKSGSGLLPFPGTSGDSRGYAYQIDQPHLEDDSLDSAPGLLVVPQNKFNGYIQAAYPEFQIQPGDRLQTLVNCEFGATRCYATFRIDYILPNGVQRTLWSWKEAYDKRFYRADIDLSSLAGQKVRFVFMLLSTGFASGDRALWGSPRIVRTGSTQPPAPPATLTPLPPLPPTATPIAQPPPTVVPSGCDKAAFVTDATVPDGTTFSPGAAFTKTWRLRNAGSCTWTTSYKLVYYSGEPMSAPTSVNLPWAAAWGQTVDISVNMVASTTPGKYRGYWILSNANGQYFGIGAAATDPIWVEINVAGEAPHEGGYNFWQNACSAQWRSGAGVLPCPGTEGDSKGFVIPLNNSHLEDGTMGPAPSLLISPENKYNGYIQGIFPTFTIQPGDHFVSVVGCEHEYSCYVTFRLDYMTANGGIFNFWSWREKSDNQNYMANVDLTPLAGRSVRFILTVLATGSSAGDRVRWGAPSIVRGGGAPPTITPVPPTVTMVPNDWLRYENPAYGFKFQYPPQSERFFETGNSILIKMPIAPGTNLVEKYLQVNARVANPCQSPLSAISPPGSPTETVVINGISFLKQTGGDAGVGHLHEWVGYSTLKNNTCISMDFVLHSLNAGNFDPPKPEFDKAAESAVFTQVMSTFAWLTTTPPPTAIPPQVVPSPNILKLFMSNETNGWALGANYVLRTTDGGATWYNMIPGLTSVRNGFFRNSNQGWVLTTDSIYHTTNGGNAWTRYSVPFNGGYIQFLDDLNGFVLSGEGSGMQKQAVYLYQTSDGGATWTLKYANDPSQPNNTLPFSGHKNGMQFRDTTTGWVGGEVPSEGVYIFKTTNSGVSWSQQPLTLPAGNESAITSTTAPIFFGANDAILPVRMDGNAGKGIFLYVTHNGGATWSLSPAFAPAYSRNFDFVSINDGFVWDGGAGAFHVTNNSGTSWRQVISNVNFGEIISALDFVSTTTGWAYDTDSNGNGALYRTTDGGSTWTQLYGNIPTPTPTPTSTPNLNGLVTNASLSHTLSGTSCSTTGMQVDVTGTITTSGPALVTYHWEVTGDSVQQVSPSATFPFAGAMSQTVSNSFHLPCGSHAILLVVTSPNETRAQVNVPLYPPASPAEFAQTVVNALNARNFNALPAMMDQTFAFGYWQSQGTSYPSDQAIDSLRTSLTVMLAPNASKDLTSLLGGLNPYSIMGLDPSKSYGSYVSGWGSDSKAEAILYVTQRADSSLYWHSVLVAPTGFAPPATLAGPYAVVRVALSDVLNIRAGAGASQPLVGSFPSDSISVMRTGLTASADNVTWWEVQNPNGGRGWVNSYYLTEYVSHDIFCADTRIPALIQQLKGSMNQSNGDMFAGLVSPVHGTDVRLWAYGTEVKNYTTTTARTIFTSTEVFQWGSGPVGGTEYGKGTFAQIIQPKVLEVVNAPNMETYCDNLTKAFPLPNAWPYPNIRYSNLYKPASAQFFDYRTWLIGFEYINGQPYLYSMVSIVWEP